MASYKGIRVVKNMVSCRTQARSNGNYIYGCTLHIDMPKKKKKSQAPADPKASYSQPPIKRAKGKDCFIHFMYV